MTQTAPLILTLTLDKRSFAFFDEQRRRHFPPQRNFIPAHLTLFHHLPGHKAEGVTGDLHDLSRRQAPFALAVTGLRSLGRGVAYELASPDLERLHMGLAATWRLWLTAQDRQKLRPHVTVQNKVDPPDARALLTELTAAFAPFTATAVGLDLWWYRGGPWEKAQTFPFIGA